MLRAGYGSLTTEAQVWLQTREAFYPTALTLAFILKGPHCPINLSYLMTWWLAGPLLSLSYFVQP